MRRKLSFIVLSLLLITLFAICPKHTVNAANTIDQTGYTLTSASIRWYTPTSPKYEIINWYKVTWEVDGRKKSATISGNSIGLKYTITGLEAASSYPVTITYEYITDDGAQHIDTYASTVVHTKLLGFDLAGGKSNFSLFNLTYKVRMPAGEYQIVCVSGNKPDYNKYDHISSNGEKSPSYEGRITISKTGTYTFNWTADSKKHGCATIICRRIKDNITSGWTSLRVVPDPIFTAERKNSGISVSVDPLKGAQSYDVYVGTYKGTSKKTNNIIGKNFVKVGTINAKKNKTATKLFKKYNGKKINKLKSYVVKVVANSAYGISDGYFVRVVW